MYGVKLTDELPSKELSVRLGLHDIIRSCATENGKRKETSAQIMPLRVLILEADQKEHARR